MPVFPSSLRSPRRLCTGLLAVLVGAAALLLPPRAAAQEKDYEEWRRQQRQKYKQFLNEQDQAFLKFLKKQWKNVGVDAAAGSPIDEKPRQIPRVDDRPAERTPAEPRTDDAPTDEAPPEDESARTEDPQEDSPRTSPPPPNPPAREEDPTTEPTPTDDRDPAPNPDTPSPTPDAEPEPEEELEEEPPMDEPSPPRPDRSPADNPARDAAEASASLNREASLSFFGVSTTVPYGAASTPSLEGGPNKSSIRSFWKTMAKGPYQPTLDALQTRREDLNLSDWGYYRYLRDLSTQLYDDGASNEQVLWTWFMMMKSGYGARVGYRGSEVFLMLPVDQKIFGRPQMHLDGQRYYLMVENMTGSLRTYDGQHEEADQVLQLDEGTLPNVAEERATRTVEFSFDDQRHSFDLAYNPSTVDYLQSYPNVDLDVLMSAGVSSAARTAFEETLQPLVADRPPREAVNLLLTFAQFATDYKRDQEHFGEERYLFPEESLATDYSDCEDRAVLLSYLVRTLLDREVVGLRWPRHVALAVRANNGLSVADDDHTVTVDGDTYIFADPTYIGSNLGMEMPIVEGTDPEIISL